MKRRFEFASVGSSKFWEVAVDGSDLTVSFGKLGTAGQEKVKSFTSSAAAAKEAEKLIAEKTRKGYVEAKTGPSSAKKNKALGAVETKVLGGRAMPRELAAFWALGNEAFYGGSDYGEVTLLSKPSESVAHYTAASDGDVWAALFAEIAWFAEEADGGVIGYFHRGSKSLDEAPIVYLDNEGQLLLTGRTLVDHFAWKKDDAELDELDAFCKANDLPKRLSASAREKSVRGVVTPEERFQMHQKAAAAPIAANTPPTRPLDRNPKFVAIGDGRSVWVSTEDELAKNDRYQERAAFVFDGAAERFREIKPMPLCAPEFVGAGRLDDGRAVFVGAVGHPEEAQVAVYDPTKDDWFVGPAPEENTREFDAAVVSGNAVLVAGAGLQVFDVTTRKWSAIDTDYRRAPRLQALPDGRVVVLALVRKMPKCELVDPRARTVVELAAPIVELDEYRALDTLLLRDGRVLVLGSGEAALLDPLANEWDAIDCDGSGGAMIEIADGQVAFFDCTTRGASPAARILDVKRKKWSTLGGTVLDRNESRSLLLPNGTVLFVGGTYHTNHASEPEIWDPKTGRSRAIAGFEKALAKQQKIAERSRAKG